MDEFEKKLQGIIDSFKWAIEEKTKKGEDIEIENKCLDECEVVMKYIKMYKRNLI